MFCPTLTYFGLFLSLIYSLSTLLGVQGLSVLTDCCPRARALADSEQNIGHSFWFALEHYVINYTYFG